MHDLGLAVLHHLAVFGLVVMLAVQRTLLKADPIDVPRLARLDGAYGLTAIIVIAIGVLRVATGARGWAFYESNPYFWAKMAAFITIGLLSVGPTLMFLRWARAAKADPAFQPTAEDLARARRIVGIELLLIFPLVGFAAAMARYPF
jgi:putative membrane protein